MEKKYIAIIIAVTAVVVISLIISLVVESLSSLDTFEIGLQYDTIWNKLGEETYNEGLHLGPVSYEFIKFSSVFSTIQYYISCLNKDGVDITLDVSFQYRVRPNFLHEIVTQFKDKDTYGNITYKAGRSAIYEACTLFNVTQLQTERGIFQEVVGQKILDRFNVFYADVSEIQVNNIERPGAYESAIRAKERARENINVVLNERPRNLTWANTTKKNIEAQSQITINKANSDANIILNRAATMAAAILDQYDREAKVYEHILDPEGLAFTKEGFLSYLATRAIANAHNPVYVGIDAPAKTSYVTP